MNQSLYLYNSTTVKLYNEDKATSPRAHGFEKTGDGNKFLFCPKRETLILLVVCDTVVFFRLRPYLYSLRCPRQHSPRFTLAGVAFISFLGKIQPAVYIRIAKSARFSLMWSVAIEIHSRMSR